MYIIEKYRRYCMQRGIPFQMDNNVKSYDDTSLFCPAGMQQFKDKFKDENYKGTISNIQSCLRLNDIDEIGDGEHLLYFNMIGLFSFRTMTMQESVDFFMGFLDEIGIQPDEVTIHPDCEEWVNLYVYHDVALIYDKDCKWSDGDIGGYCTEFYKDGIEIGNIVNPLGTCIDIGFGLERLQMILDGKKMSKEETLRNSVNKIIDSGFRPSNNKQGYVLKKLLRVCYQNDIVIDHKYYHDEIRRQERLIDRWNRLKDKHKDKSKEWWWDTMGIDLDLVQ
jgi:alanyl-tRNA synthetase